MSALSGAATFHRMAVTAHPNDALFNHALRHINTRVFTPSEAGDSVTFGWVPLGDPLRLELHQEDVFVGDLVVLGFRIDERKVSAADVRDELKVRIKDVEDNTGRRLSRQERAALKETVVNELRAKAPVKRKVADVVWNPARCEARVFGATKAMLRPLCELFERTFAVGMEPMDSAELARRLGFQATREAAAAEGGVDRVPVGAEELGADFMTYLWHAGVSGEEQEVDRVPVRVLLGDLLRLKNMDGSGAEVTLKGEHASAASELFASLYRGAAITQARIQLDLNGTVVTGTLKAGTLSLGAVKLPRDPDRVDAASAFDAGADGGGGDDLGPEKEKDPARLEDEARLLSRMSWLDQAQGALDAWFLAHLKERGDGRYDGWKKQFRAWVADSVATHGPRQPAAARAPDATAPAAAAEAPAAPDSKRLETAAKLKRAQEDARALLGVGVPYIEAQKPVWERLLAWMKANGTDDPLKAGLALAREAMDRGMDPTFILAGAVDLVEGLHIHGAFRTAVRPSSGGGVPDTVSAHAGA